MDIKWIDLKQDPVGRAMVTVIVDCPPATLADKVNKIQNGKRFTLDISPYRAPKSRDQVGAIWGKIGELATALGSTKEEVYEECLIHSGPSVIMRIPKDHLYAVQSMYKLVNVKQEREDGTVFLEAYKGLSSMNTEEAAHFLESVLSDCRDIGISDEVKHD